MKYMLSLMMALALIESRVNADEKGEDNLRTTYNKKTSSEVRIRSRLTHYGETSTDDQPGYHLKNYSYIRFEDNPTGSPVNKPDNIDLENVSFKSDERYRILTSTDQFEEEKHKNFGKEPVVDHSNTDSEETYYHDSSEPEDNAEDSPNGEHYHSDENKLYLENERSNLGNLKNTNDEVPNNKVEPVTERFAFEGEHKEGEPVRKKGRGQRRKPRVHSLPGETARKPYDSPIPHYRYPSYSSSGYSGYPKPGYSVHYHIPYPGYSYHPGHPGYTGYGEFPSYQGLRPQKNPQDQDIEADTKYPTKPGTISSNGPGSGRPKPYPGQGYEDSSPGNPGQTGHPVYSGYDDSTEQSSEYRPHPGHQGYYRPVPPKTLSQRAVSAVAEALTSIALFDDKRCVPRLLCEVASGSTVNSPTLLKATAGLAPLISVLQSYNGASSSPLFIFGRAAVLGLTTKGNPTSCRYAYPQCPNDPEGLLNYLNNHNGGFFRFFGKPKEGNKEQNLEQFYNHLAGQNGQQSKPQHQNHGYHKASYYNKEQNRQRKGKDIPIDSEFANSYIEERIQNKPVIEADDDIEEAPNQGSAWTFPDEVNNKKRENKSKRQRKERSKKPNLPESTRVERGGGKLKFPDDKEPIEEKHDNFNIDRDREYIRQQKGMYFPNSNNFNTQTSYGTTPVNLEEYVFDYKHKFYVKRPKAVQNDNTETVYIVRGNGDPNHPEIVKLRPGESA